jgi:hypothetical protein
VAYVFGLGFIKKNKMKLYWFIPLIFAGLAGFLAYWILLKYWWTIILVIILWIVLGIVKGMIPQMPEIIRARKGR